MSFGPLKRRSSWPSSFLTGLIGWNGFFIILGAAVGLADQAAELFLLGSIAALFQVSLLRVFFFILRLDRSMTVGAIWGGIIGAAIVLVERRFTNIFDEHPVLWLLNGIYIGIAVGLFLSYFYRDDRRIEAEASALGQPVDYGRDAHWLEPFFFGVIAYLIAFLPQTGSLAANVAVVGAMSGVVAAGVSHFFLFRVARKSIVPFVLITLAGIVQGLLTGLLFSSFASSLLFSPLTHGAIAGALTYLTTALRGKSLASKELLARS